MNKGTTKDSQNYGNTLHIVGRVIMENVMELIKEKSGHFEVQDEWQFCAQIFLFF